MRVSKIVLILMLCLLTGCATKPNNLNDPYEAFNRRVFAFNEGVDKMVYKPMAQLYDVFIPNPLKKGVSNFFANLAEIPTVANDILQLRFKEALKASGRFAFNSTFGLGGLFDFAHKIDKHQQDLGLTFARWGAKKSPYLVLPFLGPSTVRDAIALLPNYYVTVYPYLKPQSLRYSLLGLDLIDTRASLLPADKLKAESLDPYVFVRDAYLQRRQGDNGDTYVAPEVKTGS